MKYYFTINMSYEDFLPYYQGKASTVSVETTQGQRMQFPAIHIKKYLTRLGIRGYFCMNTENNKFLSLEKIY
ncbi:MAG: DUF2835 domain-containing protein [Colwellia sp.]|nr:DUF2835 domain-containing protein [Colwellia sp.]